MSRFVLVLGAAVSLAAGASVSARHSTQDAVTLSVATPGPLKPGGVALIAVSAPQGLTALTGNLAGRPVRFWPGASAREWNGLAGVNLETAPGSIALTIQGTTASGAEATAKVSLIVERYRYETRRIQVDPKMANPPESELARIKQEAQAMADAFAILTPERFWRGSFDAPVPGDANSAFGRLTITNGKPSGRHQGADFRAATGTPVHAPNGGRIVLAQNLYFAGNTVIIDHGLGVFSLLAHLSRIDVRPGTIVARGEVVGQSGATGRVTGPHLHWAVRFGEMTVDPLSLMSAVASLQDEDAPQRAH
ncbi:MAG TPA: M23 family metallopeptidase [Vicinamibacterales bacterium]|nr:M23 family metallopeptidase [Vicinamibacterales bacterium]